MLDVVLTKFPSCFARRRHRLVISAARLSERDASDGQSLYKCRWFSCFVINTDETFALNLLPVETPHDDDRSAKTHRMKTDGPAAKCAAGAGAAPLVHEKINQIEV